MFIVKLDLDFRDRFDKVNLHQISPFSKEKEEGGRKVQQNLSTKICYTSFGVKCYTNNFKLN